MPPSDFLIVTPLRLDLSEGAHLQDLTSCYCTHAGNLVRKLPRKTAVRAGDTAMFWVELARSEGPVRWMRNQEEVVSGGRVSISNEGCCHTLTISQCTLEDMGEVVFVAGDCRTSTQFCVSG